MHGDPFDVVFGHIDLHHVVAAFLIDRRHDQIYGAAQTKMLGRGAFFGN